MAVTKANVVARFPEFAPVSEADFAIFLADAEQEISRDVWGAQGDRAVCLLAAHAIALARPELVVLTVQSVSVGSVTKTYASGGGGTETGLGATSYGAEYLRLLRKLPGVHAMVV